jgi:isopentenyl diphosphate isomerase/L-lactate dehydrogenase-like FMN-dependent dehydrogenase
MGTFLRTPAHIEPKSWSSRARRAAGSEENTLASSCVVNIEDLRRLARRRLPRAVFDYIDGGAESEATLRANSRAFEDIYFRPRTAVGFQKCEMRVRVLGREISFPVLLAPVGYSRLIHPGGEVAAARAAEHCGTVYILSTISGHKLEDVKAASDGPVWYQLYLLGGRQAAEAAIERARRAGYSALVVTVDTAVAGMRERDARNGMKQLLGSSLRAKLAFIPEILAHPRWLAAFLADGGLPKLENVITAGQSSMNLIDVSSALARAAVTWQDLEWIRKAWNGPIVVKGVLTQEDAKRAVDSGAAAVVVSNHGGRQLDFALPTPRSPRSRGCGPLSGRCPGRWGNPARHRCRKGNLHGRSCRPGRTGLCLRIGCGRKSRCCARLGNFARRHRTYSSTTWMPIRVRAWTILRGHSRKLVQADIRLKTRRDLSIPDFFVQRD